MEYRRKKSEYNRLCEGKKKEEKGRWERKAAKVKRNRELLELINRERKRRKESAHGG